MSTDQNTRKINPLWILILVMPLLGISAALLTFSLTSSQPQAAATIPATLLRNDLEGQSAPNFELPLLDSERSIRLSSLRGQVVFVNFWATWCAPCRREFPAFQQFNQSQPDAPARILAVNVGETAAQIQDFLAELDIDPAAIDILQDADFAVSDAYATNYFPATFVIDPAGIVAAVHLGEITPQDLEDYIAEHQ